MAADRQFSAKTTGSEYIDRFCSIWQPFGFNTIQACMLVSFRVCILPRAGMSWHLLLQFPSLLNPSSKLLCVAGPLSARSYLTRILLVWAERTAETAVEGYAEKLCFNKGFGKARVVVIALPSNRKASH